MTTWFSSDQHFGHNNIIGFCQRPFVGVEEMNAELVRRWNAVVEPGDTVYVLGDFALGRIEQTLAIVSQLVGRKILVVGNHDRCWKGHGARHLPMIGWYIEAGFKEIHQGTINLEIEGTPVQACHFPYTDDKHTKDPYKAHRPVDTGGWLLHGHVHEKWQRLGRMINVGVDVWDFTPVSEAQLAELIRLGPMAKEGWSESAARTRCTRCGDEVVDDRWGDFEQLICDGCAGRERFGDALSDMAKMVDRAKRWPV